MVFLVIMAIVIGLFILNNRLDAKGLVGEAEPLFGFLKEDDYDFFLKVRYGDAADSEKLFNQRIRNAVIIIVLMLFVFITSLSFVNVLFAFILGFLVFKMPYTNLKNYYNNNLAQINLLLPYYLKGLEILVQHYTVPVALARSISTAPDIFKPGLKKLVERIEQGDSSIDPYMEFAREYPVRDSMRMMRLLYRLGLGSQENKQEQLLMFSRTISTLQNKAREQKYQERLEKMEKKTMVMLFSTGAGILLLLMISLTTLMSI